MSHHLKLFCEVPVWLCTCDSVGLPGPWRPTDQHKRHGFVLRLRIQVSGSCLQDSVQTQLLQKFYSKSRVILFQWLCDYFH